MNDDYYKILAEDTRVPKATTEGTIKIWLRKALFNPGSYALFIICIITIVIIFITYWRYFRPKWYKKNI